MHTTPRETAITAACRAITIAHETLEDHSCRLAHFGALFEAIDRLSDDVQLVSHLSTIGSAYADYCAITLVPNTEALDAAQVSMRSVIKEIDHV